MGLCHCLRNFVYVYSDEFNKWNYAELSCYLMFDQIPIIFPINVRDICTLYFFCQWHCSGVFIVNIEQILHIAMVFPFLTLNKWLLPVETK